MERERESVAHSEHRFHAPSSEGCRKPEFESVVHAVSSKTRDNVDFSAQRFSRISLKQQGLRFTDTGRGIYLLHSGSHVTA